MQKISIMIFEEDKLVEKSEEQNYLNILELPT